MINSSHKAKAKNAKIETVVEQVLDILMGESKDDRADVLEVLGQCICLYCGSFPANDCTCDEPRFETLEVKHHGSN
jgi:hypothetical protein